MATRPRTFRVDDDLWAAAKGAAAAEGRTVTDVIVAALRRLVANGPSVDIETALSRLVPGAPAAPGDEVMVAAYNTGFHRGVAASQKHLSDALDAREAAAGMHGE